MAVLTKPVGTILQIDGKTLESIAIGGNVFPLATGEHRLVLTKDGYDDFTIEKVMVTESTRQLGPYELTKKSVPITTADVLINTEPPGAEIELDGTLLRPIKDGGSEFRLNLGEHTVTATMAGYQTHKEKVKVTEAGDPITITFVALPVEHTPENKPLQRGDDFKVWFDKGKQQFNRREFGDAIVTLGRALEVDPKQAVAYMYLGHAKYDNGQHQEAIIAYDKAIELDDKLIQAYTGRSLAQLRANDFEAAQKDAEAATKLDPKYAPAFNLLGKALFNLKKVEDAKGAFSTAISINPDYDEALFNRAKIYSEQAGTEADEQASKDLYKKAIDDFTHVIDVKDIEFNMKANAYNGRGVARMKSGARKEAIADYKEALRLNPNHKYAKQNLDSATGK